jgi:hypothetical protein
LVQLSLWLFYWISNMPDDQVTYQILRETARDRTTRTYGELSQLYRDRTGVWFEPHGSWDQMLDNINKRLESVDLPPLSAVIVNQDTQEPGGGFWGCCARTQNPPRLAEDRRLEHIVILHDVYAASWPSRLP